MLVSNVKLGQDLIAFTPVDAIQQSFEILRSKEGRKPIFFALKNIKNALVGNRSRKLDVLLNRDHLNLLLSLVEQRSELTIEAVNLLGVAILPQPKALQAIFDVQLLEHLAALLAETCQNIATASFRPTELVIAVLKTTRNIFRAIHQAIELLFANPAQEDKEFRVDKSLLDRASSLFVQDAVLSCLLRLLYLPLQDTVDANLECASLASAILCSCCTDDNRQMAIFAAGHHESFDPPLSQCLMALIDTHQDRYSVVESALNLLAGLAKEHSVVANRIELTVAPSKRLPIDIMTDLTNHVRPELRLAAATCATILFKSNSPDHQPLLHLMPVANMRQILLALIRLLSISQQMAAEAIFVIALLVHDTTHLQLAVCEMGIMQKCEQLLRQARDKTHAPYRSPKQVALDLELAQAVYSCVAAIALPCEKARKLVIDAELVGFIVGSLGDDDARIRSAACQCARALSRSVSLLRTYLVDAGAAKPLFRLLFDPSETVQTTAVATCANLLIEFSPMKEVLIEANVVPRLVQLTKSPSNQLRLNSLVALKNMTFWSDSTLKQLLMHEMGWPYLQNLIDDPDADIQAQGLNLLRNLATSREEDIAWCLHGIGEANSIVMLQNKLASTSDEVLLQALHVAQHFGTLSKGRELLFLNSSVLASILQQLSHRRKDIRIIAVWVTSTLAKRETNQRRINENALRLRALGFEARLQEMQAQESALDMRERVRDAMEAFDTASFAM